jgi:hypothetical protein
MCSGAAVQLLWVLLVCTLASSAGQMPMPFSGAGDKPPAVPTDVFVSTYVERMLSVNDRSYDFQAGGLSLLCVIVPAASQPASLRHCRGARRAYTTSSCWSGVGHYVRTVLWHILIASVQLVWMRTCTMPQ